MLYFHCKFLLETGAKVDAIIPAEDHVALVERIASYDGILLKTIRLPQRTFRMSHQDLLFFFTYLREFLNAEIPLVEAVDTIAEETRKTNIKAIATKLIHDIRDGCLLSDAMLKQRTVFDGTSIGLIAVAEKMNEVASACGHIVNYLTFNADLKRRVRSTMMYPIVMFSMLFGMVLFYSKVVIPKLQAIFTEFSTGEEVPIQTRALVVFADFISNYWLYTALIVFFGPIIMATLYKFSHKMRFKIDALLLKIPFISTIVIRSQLSKFCLFVANVYDKGYNFLDSIAESTIVLTNAKVRYDLEEMIDNIRSGELVYRALRKIDYIPRFTHRMFRIAELTGNVSRPLMAVHEFYSQEVKNDLEKLMRFIKPASILLIGLLMLWIVSATLLPFYAKIPQLLDGTHA